MFLEMDGISVLLNMNNGISSTQIEKLKSGKKMVGWFD